MLRKCLFSLWCGLEFHEKSQLWGLKVRRMEQEKWGRGYKGPQNQEEGNIWDEMLSN